MTEAQGLVISYTVPELSRCMSAQNEIYHVVQW